MNNCLKIMVLSLIIAATSCSKSDEGRDGGFEVGVPSFVKQQTLIPVVLSVDCDAMPTVRFASSEGALGVVTMTQDVKLGVDYVYAGESIPVTFANGHASATFWYVPLTAGDHGVAFEVSYRQGGEQRVGTAHETFGVSDAANGGFYPEVTSSAGYYYFNFHNEVSKGNDGCKMYMRFEDVNGETDTTIMDIILSQGKDPDVLVTTDVFYPITWSKWDAGYQDWIGGNVLIIRNDLIDPITMKLIFCDDFNRCRDVVVKLDKNRNMISSTSGNYYLLPRNK